jgi:ATP-dependent DNA helicase DinG
VISVEDIFREGLADAIPNYRERPAQVAMARAVEAAIQKREHLFVEAGTGTGKSLAYLLPALASGLRVIVSTATKTLQEQLYNKDVPAAKELLSRHGLAPRVELLKGLSNYLCLRRLDEARLQGDPHTEEGALLEWTRTTRMGDRSELKSLSEHSPLWQRVQSSSDTRVGSRCEYYEQCFVTSRKRDAAEADLVIVNHHLLLSDLALRSEGDATYASVLPPYDVLIIDEAHQLEDIATGFFGSRVSTARVERLLGEARKVLSDSAVGDRERETLVRATTHASEHLLEVMTALGRHSHGAREPSRDKAPLPLRELSALLSGGLPPLLANLRVLTAIAEERGAKSDAAFVLARRLRALIADLDLLSQSHDDESNRVAWIEHRDRSIALCVNIIDVAEKLRVELFERVPTVIATSATLATHGGLDFSRKRLGATQRCGELVLTSPFEFETKALLYVPADLPPPTDPSYDRAALRRIVELVTLTDGGTFVLCTSTQRMDALYKGLSEALPCPVLVQGSAPKSSLLDQFRADARSVLVATMSFWEGVDVPGFALRLVIMDKLPFAVPTDPIVAARCEKIDAEGGSSFSKYTLPSAILTLKQGFGRLIRSETDIGIVAILDSRILSKGYGKLVLRSLPPARRVAQLDDLRSAWAALAPPNGPPRTPHTHEK